MKKVMALIVMTGLLFCIPVFANEAVQEIAVVSIAEMPDSSEKQALLERAKIVGLTDTATEAEVIAAETGK